LADARRPTIRDVAATAGVSIQTVSRVTNGRPDVAPETVSRVLEAIHRLGYTPNMLARSLTVGRSQVLGVVAYGLEYFGPSRTVSAIERRAAQLGYGISLTLILKPETDDVGAILDALRARQVDGIIWAVPEVADNMAWSRTRGPQLPVPAMLVGMAGSSYLPSIGIDNTAIGRVATNYLLGGGVRNIGIITGPLNWREARHRLAGWRSALDTAGRAVGPHCRACRSRRTVHCRSRQHRRGLALLAAAHYGGSADHPGGLARGRRYCPAHRKRAAEPPT
jgi:LacI family transcriptional regulator